SRSPKGFANSLPARPHAHAAAESII
ncbi:MAG: hypothetical protein QOI09_2285, partial [Chloroflexota bacterium]|nr:hypothetical protein [Chloroflexota bacterium]